MNVQIEKKEKCEKLIIQAIFSMEKSTAYSSLLHIDRNLSPHLNFFNSLRKFFKSNYVKNIYELRTIYKVNVLTR